MRSAALTLALAAIVTLLIGIGVSMTPVFAGDVAVTRAVQAIFPDPSWAVPISRLAAAPSKYIVMALALGVSYLLAGWRGPVVGVIVILLDQYGSEASKAIFSRPRPSPELVAVVGKPSGYSFPSGTLTFFSATFGWVGILAARARAGRIRTAAGAGALVMIVLGCLARVVLGAHWPSDVVLTTMVCLTWLWAAERTLRTG